MSYRLTVRIAVVLLLVLGAGCVSAVTGDTLEFSADPVGVSEDALAESGFQLEGSDTVVVERTVSLAGVERDVHITNHVASYSAEDGGAAPASVVVMATPKAEVAGQAANPLGRLDRDELVDRVVSQTDGLEDVTRVGAQELRILDSSVAVTKYRASTQDGGDVFVHLVRLEHGDDYIIAAATYPTENDGVEEDVFALFEGISR